MVDLEQTPEPVELRGRIPDPTRVKASTVAAILGVSPATVHHLQIRGVLRAVETGWFNLADCVKAYIEYKLDGTDGGKKKKTSEKIEDQKLRKLKIENDLKEGLTVLRQDAEVVFNEAMAIVGRGLESLPGRLAGQMVGIKEPAVARDRLMKECRKVRQEASDKLQNLAAIQYVEAPAEGEATTDAATGTKKRVRSGKDRAAKRGRDRARKLRRKAGAT